MGAFVLLVSVAAVRLAVRSGLPSLLLYLAIGIAIGESGLGIDFESTTLTQVLGYSALVLILAEGGLTTRGRASATRSRRRRCCRPSACWCPSGVVGVAAHFLLHVSWTNALLVGAVLSSTDAAAVFSVLRRVPLPRRVTGMLEAESGFNDAPVVLLVVTLAEQSAPGAQSHPWWALVLIAVLELAGGSAIGLAIGSAAGACSGWWRRPRPACSPSASSP